MNLLEIIFHVHKLNISQRTKVFNDFGFPLVLCEEINRLFQEDGGFTKESAQAIVDFLYNKKIKERQNAQN